MIQGAALHRDIAKTVRPNRHAGERERRRIKPQRLADDRLGVGKLRQRLGGGVRTRSMAPTSAATRSWSAG